MTCSADRKGKSRGQVERVEADFAVHAALIVQVQGQPPAQPRTGGDAVEIVETQLVAGEGSAREQPDVPQRVVWRQAEDRRQIDAANPQVHARLRCPWIGRAL